MYRKLLLYGITFFYCNIISDTTPLPKLIIPTAAFDFIKAKHTNKKNKVPVTPFWETSKKNNVVDTAALKQSGWYAGIIKNIEAGEYEISKDEKPGTYVAANPQQQLKVSFNYNSFTLQPGSAEQDWILRMQLLGIYADKKLVTWSDEKDLPVIGANKIVFNNTNFATEYINSKEGIRQNFIIQKEPASKPQTINIKLQTHKGWYINKVHDKELHFAKQEGDQLSKKITYNSLKVWDANNKELDARFIVNTKHTAFEIEVNTKDAVYPITVDPLSASPATILNGISAGDNFGYSVASAGDVNGDGYSDVIVGAYGVASFKGAAYLFLGSSTGLAASPAATLNGVSSNDYFGYSVASAGDVNGDGYSDVIVGAYGVASNKGAAYLFLGSSSGLAASPATTLNGVGSGDYFGYSVASAGDVNGNGYSDVIVGAYGVASNKGAAYLFLGSSSGLAASPATTLNGVGSGDYFGYSVASAGDVNGNGYSDVIVGAYGVASNKGAAYLFLGSSTGLAASPATTLNGISTNDYFGISVASAGDVNGDGYSDVIVGAYGVASAAYLFPGNSPGGYRNNLRLYNTDLITPIQQSNVLVPNLFGAGLFSKSALGRVKGKLVWEVKQQGQPFSGNPITNSTAYLDKLTSFTDLGTAGTELKSNVQKVGRQNKIRARVEYDKATAITGQVYGPWRYPAAYLQGAHGMNSVPLPVKLNWFTGALVGVKVKLQWQSSDDENIAAYKIERSSDNRNFTAIGSVSSLHQNRNSYNFTDNQPLKGTSWYRLKITDEYNRINYSGTVVIKNTNDAVSIYPTVISKGGHVNLQFKNSVTGALEIRLVNMSGAIVFKKLMATNGNTLILELPSLPSGVYILSAMQNGEKLITQKIIIR